MKAKVIVLVLGFTLLIGTGVTLAKELQAMQTRHMQQMEQALNQ